MPTPAEIRRSIERKQNLGKALITIGLAVGLLGAYLLSVEWQLIGDVRPVSCGLPLEPREVSGYDGVLCGQTLREQVLYVGVCVFVTVAALAVGIATLVRNPSR